MKCIFLAATAQAAAGDWYGQMDNKTCTTSADCSALTNEKTICGKAVVTATPATASYQYCMKSVDCVAGINTVYSAATLMYCGATKVFAGLASAAAIVASL